MTRLYAIYDDPEQLVAAIRSLRARGHERLEAYTPFPVEGVSEALGLAPSRIPSYAFASGLAAAAITYLVQWLINDWSYPINVGGRPPHFPLSYVPVCFEVGVLFAALTCVIAVAIAGRFGALWAPVFELGEFAGVTRDQHWLELCVEQNAERARLALASTHPLQILEAP
jgi:hypothetical protein